MRDIKELETFEESDRKAICKRVEKRLFKENKLYLFLHFIRGFFPGVAILAFLEAYYRTTIFRDHSLVTGFVLGIASIAIWIWVEYYKSSRISTVLPEVLEEMGLNK